MKKIMMFLLVYACLCFSVLASPLINASFNEFYYSNKISPRHCGQNINNFVQYLAQKGQYHPEMKVLSFEAPSNPWSFYNVAAVNSRWDQKIGASYHENWAFHVIAVLDGYVYDFSFERSPRVIKVRDYFREMMVPKQPLALYGLDFRIRGEGPYYTPDHARRQLEGLVFKIFQVESNGRQTLLQANVSYQDVLRHFGN